MLKRMFNGQQPSVKVVVNYIPEPRAIQTLFHTMLETSQ